MSEALYRKYRPQKWADIAGQNHIKITLQNEIAGNKLAHAFLFCGPRGTGKTTTARILAKAINCEKRKDGESEPCGKCNSCTEIMQGRDLDLLEIDAASNTGVDNVRENIIANSRFTPSKRKFKVFIIDEVHMLSLSAFNALLKVLEEPPAHVIFILATTEAHKIPATIISRCQRFDFHKIAKADLLQRLTYICSQEQVSVESKVLEEIARFSEGCLRDAESLLSQILSLGEKNITQAQAELVMPRSNYLQALNLLKTLEFKNGREAVLLINTLAEDGIDLVNFTNELIEMTRKVLLARVGGNLKDFSIELEADLEKEILDLSAKLEIKPLLRLIDVFAQKRNEIKYAVLPQLPLEMAVLEFCEKGPESGARGSEQNSQSAKPKAQDSNSNNPKPPSEPPAQSAELKAQSPEPPATGPEPIVQNLVVNSTLENIRNSWGKFLNQMQAINASMVMILKLAEPLELTGNRLKIGFKFDFHQNKIRQNKNREQVEEGLFLIFGDRICIDTCLFAKDYRSEFIENQTKHDDVEFVEEVKAESGTQEDLISNMVKAFGGKVVE